ncbi:unnamed protein product [Oikopleura dioica]|uniref:Uncharacterized protein n=1 Tax=Oikopleura dioica TaxID=34765 RepID=E4YGQ6_OIKDI|nr:unnamed protein product [Oikopleura dioica]
MQGSSSVPPFSPMADNYSGLEDDDAWETILEGSTLSIIADEVETLANGVDEELSETPGPSKRRKVSPTHNDCTDSDHDENSGNESHSDYSFFCNETLDPVPFERAIKFRQNIKLAQPWSTPRPKIARGEANTNWNIRVRRADGTWGMTTRLTDPKNLFVDRRPPYPVELPSDPLTRCMRRIEVSLDIHKSNQENFEQELNRFLLLTI